MDLNHPGESLITSVEKQKRRTYRYNIYLNDNYAFSIHEDMLIKYRLLKGEVVNREQLKTIIAEEDRHQAFLAAISYIGRRPRSKKEVARKLKEKGYEEETISTIIQRLVEQKYLDDEQFAKMWTEHRIFSQKKGRRWVQQELSQKGIASDLILSAFSEVTEESEYECAMVIALKKWKVVKGEKMERRRKLAAFLLQRGYTNSMVRNIVKQVTNKSIDDLDD